jgi:hypothetical protein
MLPPSVAVAGPVSVTARSADGLVLTTDPVTVAELLAGFGSALLLLTDAVSEKFAPLARLPGADTTRVKVSVWPAPTPDADPVTVLPLCVKVKLSGLPAAGVSATNVAPEGRTSLRVTPWAAPGPLLVSVIVYVALVPAVTVDGPRFVTARSAAAAGALGAKLATAVPQLAVACVLANSLAAQNEPLTGSTLMPLRSPARWLLVKSL